MLDICIFI